jgi:hypothetical protein
MDTISRNNYEVWFIDYLDGQLDCGQVDQLLDFLNENPDLRNELEAAAGIRLTITEDQMDNKDALKYSATDIPVFLTLIIAALPGWKETSRPVKMSGLMRNSQLMIV